LLHVYSTKRQNDKTTKRQNVRSVKSKNKSFTLLEIVFAIVIIGILLAIFLPVMSSIKLAAQKIKDQSNLKTIAGAWKTYTIDNNWGTIIPYNGFELLHYLSGGSLQSQGWQGQERCILNDSYVYVSPGDRYASKVLKEAISSPAGNADAYLESYVRVKNDITISGDAVPLSYCLISGLSASVPLATTPLGFTRGLRKDGKWDERVGLYGSKGGYVVFCDGHTTWLDGSKPARFLKWDRSGYTSDIREAVPSSAFISCGNETVKSDYKSDGSDEKLVILHHAGTGDD
jgi:type II secretory pathway pseudopilin PulG